MVLKLIKKISSTTEITFYQHISVRAIMETN